jgi:hypothetical protein
MERRNKALTLSIEDLKRSEERIINCVKEGGNELSKILKTLQAVIEQLESCITSSEEMTTKREVFYNHSFDEAMKILVSN